MITIWEAIQKRSQKPIYKTPTKIEAKRLRATTKWGAIEESPILLSQYWKNYHWIQKRKGTFLIISCRNFKR